MAMLAANAGMSLINHWRGTKNNANIQRKQEEFAKAAAERNHNRMRELMLEGQKLTEEVEKETHEQRINDIRQDFDNLLQRFAYAETIKSWPLRVLPIVMKNQTLGTLLHRTEDVVALHCIFTPSNDQALNKEIVPVVEMMLESYCNQHWNTLSEHPVIFYGGAWKSQTAPTGIEIDQLKANLDSLPTLIITPFFKPDETFVFQVKLWGIGIDIDTELIPSEFSYSYKPNMDYKMDKDLRDSTIEDFVPYLQCLIGYIADQYFWSAYQKSPLLPFLLSMNEVSTDGRKYLIDSSKERYNSLFNQSVDIQGSTSFASDDLISLIEACSSIYEDNVRKERLEQIFVLYCNGITDRNLIDFYEAISTTEFLKEDIPFLTIFFRNYNYQGIQVTRNDIMSELHQIDFDYSLLNCLDISYLKQLAEEGNPAAAYRLGEIYEFSISVKYNKEISEKYYTIAFNKGFIFAILHFSIEQDDTNAINKYLNSLVKLCSQNIEIAIVRLSQLYYYGLSVQENKDKAIELIENLDDIKHPYSLYWGAKMVVDLFGKEQAESIEKLLVLSADMGYIQAQMLLINMYCAGHIVDKNPKKAAIYARKAAEQGCISAITKLGSFYILGFGVPISIPIAKELLTKSAQYNDQEALKILKQIK